MPLGIQQNNHLQRITLDVWQDQVFLNEKAYPAGYFAAEILNQKESTLQSLIQFGGNISYEAEALLFQRMEEVLTPRDLNLVRCYLGIGQPEERSMTFQELAVWLNYNGPSGAEKAYKSAIRKLKRHLHGGDYGAWLDIQRVLREAQREAGREAEYGSPQATWLEEQELIQSFLCNTAALSRVFLVLRAAGKDGQRE